MTELERAITELTQEVGGQLPRPWMTDLTAPHEANVFIVGKNQRNGYEASRVTHARHIDALFNRSGESCRGLYDELTGFSPSPTRVNTDRLRALLYSAGVQKVLETNVVCYSTPMSSHLRSAHHVAGAKKGRELFTVLLRIVQPKVLIVHGSGASQELGQVLGVALPSEPTEPSPPNGVKVGRQTVFVIPSLAPPAWNRWSKWSGPYLQEVASAVAKAL